MRPLRRIGRKTLALAGWALLAVLLLVLLLRSLGATRGPALETWHTFAPAEMSVSEMEASDWGHWMQREQAAFEAVRQVVSEPIAADPAQALNRFAPSSRVYPPRLPQDWNRSYVMEPEGSVRGVVVLLHGMTDSPYSLRHVASHYRERGFIAIGLRIPGHGTTPGGLARARTEDWVAATRLALREAARRRPPGAPLHVVGYSNGAALALIYALEADGSATNPRPTQLVLLSPMVGVDAFARFAGIAGLPALLPKFAKAAWLDVLPEFNPFKYNSFPVHAARESWRMTRRLEKLLAQPDRAAQLPPVLTFLSVLDNTVKAPAVLTGLYDRLAANDSTLVLFDINRAAFLDPLLKPEANIALEQLLPQEPRRYAITVVTNQGTPDGALLRQRPAGSLAESVEPLGARYPVDMYSLSHIALPFPVSDSLYGRDPQPRNEFGVSLGTVAPRGERGVLIMGLDGLMRATSNPFFDYMISRIDATLP